MRFSAEQLDTLAHSGVGLIRPTRINDSQRIDLTTRAPFLAIDRAFPHEVDDAIRALPRKGGGYIVEIAIADGAQVPATEEIIQAAVEKKETNYTGGTAENQILPHHVITELQLSGHATQRALVVSTHYNAETELIEDATEVFPATVTPVPMTIRDFVKEYINGDGAPAAANPTVRFGQRYRRLRNLPLTDSVTSREDIARAAHELVQTYMVLANVAVADWTLENSLPIIYRGPYSSIDRLMAGRPVFLDSPATYFTDPAIACGEGTIPYARASSPLRRTGDLINHMQIGHRLANLPLPFTKHEIESFAHALN